MNKYGIQDLKKSMSKQNKNVCLVDFYLQMCRDFETLHT